MICNEKKHLRINPPKRIKRDGGMDLFIQPVFSGMIVMCDRYAPVPGLGYANRTSTNGDSNP